VREAIRVRHYSVRTERTYVHWILRYLRFHGRRHPRDLGAEHVTAFLSSLANQGHVAAATLEPGARRSAVPVPPGSPSRAPMARFRRPGKKAKRLPTVLTREEVRGSWNGSTACMG
jgi:integrase